MMGCIRHAIPLPDTFTHELDDDVAVFSIYTTWNHTTYPPQHTFLDIFTHKLHGDIRVCSTHTIQNHTPYPPRPNIPDTHIHSPDSVLVAFSA